MENQELQDIVLRNTAELAEIRQQLQALTSKEQRAARALQDLRQRFKSYLDAFDRDKYKATDQRLLITALANEIRIFDKLGYDIGESGAHFLLGVADLLEGRNQAALEQLKRYIGLTAPDDRNLRNAHYLGGMVSYNRREFSQATEFFSTAFRLSPDSNRDWQSATYVAELAYFMRMPQDVVERLFFDVDEQLSRLDKSTPTSFMRATLYLKLGNCYVETFLAPKEANPMRNNPLAIRYYKEARNCCPRRIESESLLPVIIDSSLAQALILSQSLDFDLPMTPSELFADVFHRLRRIVLTKREEIILAQCYLILGICALYSSDVAKDVGEIYLEYARHQTQVVPSDMCFYSSITKELLSRDEFVRQIDYYARELEQ